MTPGRSYHVLSLFSSSPQLLSCWLVGPHREDGLDQDDQNLQEARDLVTALLHFTTISLRGAGLATTRLVILVPAVLLLDHACSADDSMNNYY